MNNVFVHSKENNEMVFWCSKMNNVVGVPLSVLILLAPVHVHHLGGFFCCTIWVFPSSDGVCPDTCMYVWFVNVCVTPYMYVCVYPYMVRIHTCIQVYRGVHTHLFGPPDTHRHIQTWCHT